MHCCNICSIITFGLAPTAHSVVAITIPTVPVGNVGNANDPATGNLYGGVSYAYNIGTNEVTVGQYTAFLNAVAATDTYSLYNTSMAMDLNIAGIVQSGASGSYTYSMIGSANHPVTYVSWADAARFANWLNNGQPTGAQNSTTTEDGAYTLNGATSSAALQAVSRNASAKWFLPTENEWYKAAYHKNDGVTNDYWQYPTGTNTTPISAPPGNTPNTANFYGDATGFAVTGSLSYSSQNYLSDVGAYTTSPSPYGTFDQGGNVLEWNETTVTSSSRGESGGFWGSFSGGLQASGAFDVDPTYADPTLGFRVASILATTFQGDFNGDGKVDAADYVTWRNNGGSVADYDKWRANFGATSASGASFSAAVPEPSARTLLTLSFAYVALFIFAKRLPFERRQSRNPKTAAVPDELRLFF